MAEACLKTRSPTSFLHRGRTIAPAHPYLAAAAAVISALTVTALANRHLAKKAAHDNPPLGRFLMIDGVRLHYVDWGTGEALVLLHGNGSMIQDFELERADRFGREKLSGHRFRQAGVWPQHSASQSNLDTRSPS